MGFGGLYFATPDKLDTKVPFTDKRVRQAMNMAINRQAIAKSLLGGKVEPVRIAGYHPKLDAISGLGSGTLIGISGLKSCTVMTRSRRRRC